MRRAGERRPFSGRLLLLAAVTAGFLIALCSSAYAASQNVYRFYNVQNGSHFYTASNDEWWTVTTNWPNIYRSEGVAWTINTTAAKDPLHRFYNMINGSHFYTASSQEMMNVLVNLRHVYKYEGVAYNVSATWCPGAPVHRFYHKTLGTHFYTASAEEANNIRANLAHVYSYDGIAFWIPTAPTAPVPKKTASNYCNSWAADDRGTFWPVAEQAVPFQQAKGYTTRSNSGVHAASIYADMQTEGVVISASHSNKGFQVFRTSGGDYTCISTVAGHAHASEDCIANYDLSKLRGINSPTHILIWMGCHTLGQPTWGYSLPYESSLAGVDHNAAFDDEIYMNTWSGQFSYGYWRSLKNGNLTSKAMDDGVEYLRSQHAWYEGTGGYASHGYVGADVKL